MLSAEAQVRAGQCLPMVLHAAAAGSLISRVRNTRIDSDSPNPIPPSPGPQAPEPRPAPYPQRRILEEPAPEFVPHMLAQLEDELARSRKREAFWISIIVHIVLVLLIVFSPQLLPEWAQPHLLRAGDLARSKEPTFLALPQDAQKPPPKSQSDKLSDKNRIAQTQHPQIDRKTLEALRSQGNQMPPGAPEAPPSAQPEAAAPPQPPAQPAPPPAEQQPAKPQMAFTQPKPESAEKPSENPFKASGSAGASIAAATRGAPPRFPRAGGGGTGYGIGPVARNASFGPVEVLSDTQGVDFGPYLSRVLQTIKVNWYTLVPEEARPPLLKHGRVAIRFLITSDGKVAGLNVELPSGDIPLDRAAYGGITASDPFSPLPHEFHGPYLALRITFIYNPTTAEWEQLQ